MNQPGRIFFVLLLAAAVAAGAAWAPAQEAESGSVADNVPDMKWTHGPATVKLGDIAEIKVPEGLVFADAEGTKKFRDLTQNFPSGKEVGMLAKDTLEWFVIFEFDGIGYVKDDDKDKLDADRLMESMIADNAREKEERLKRGWGELKLLGWEVPPQYNQGTNNLEWATKLQSGGEGMTVNHRARLLGRKGVMNATLVVDQEMYQEALTEYRAALSGFSFFPGNRYADSEEGDKQAKADLSGLPEATPKSTIERSGRMLKLIKIIVIVVLAIAMYSLFSRFSGGKGKEGGH